MAAAERTARTRGRIAQAVITVLAKQGMSRLTHRAVAKAANVPLAATTYHYATKADMLADASQRLLDGYLAAFHRAAERLRTGTGRKERLSSFIARLVANAAGRDRSASMAWCEIILDAARSRSGRRLARTWFKGLIAAWHELAAAMGEPADPSSVLTAIDLVIGLLFMVLPLGLSPEAVEEVLRDGDDPVKAWRLGPAPTSRRKSARGSTDKAKATRARILESAIKLLVEQGAGAVTYRGVAEAGGLAVTAPAYYFNSIAEVLQAAEAELFRASKDRYRMMLSAAGPGTESLDGLADLTSAIFIREATEYGPSAVALYSTWLEAERNRRLRAEVAAAIYDQAKAWQRKLDALRDTGAFDGIRIQAIYIGKLVRAVSSGVPVEQLAMARQEFHQEIAPAAVRRRLYKNSKKD